jgi:tetratricopeptide (TPR) repeat protein
MKQPTILTIFLYFLSAVIFASCGPSQAELDATATQVAGDIFETQTAQAPTPTNTPTSREVAEEHYLIGEEFRLEKNWDLAIDAFTQAISIDPEYAEAYLNRGLSYYMNDDEENAIADFEKAIELSLDPQTPQIFNNRGRAFSIMEDADLAIADYDEAIALDPEFVEAYVRRGFNYAYFKDDFDLANVDFDKAIALDPEYHSTDLAGHHHSFEGKERVCAARTTDLSP